MIEGKYLENYSTRSKMQKEKSRGVENGKWNRLNLNIFPPLWTQGLNSLQSLVSFGLNFEGVDEAIFQTSSENLASDLSRLEKLDEFPKLLTLLIFHLSRKKCCLIRDPKFNNSPIHLTHSNLTIQTPIEACVVRTNRSNVSQFLLHQITKKSELVA